MSVSIHPRCPNCGLVNEPILVERSFARMYGSQKYRVEVAKCKSCKKEFEVSNELIEEASGTGTAPLSSAAPGKSKSWERQRRCDT